MNNEKRHGQPQAPSIQDAHHDHHHAGRPYHSSSFGSNPSSDDAHIHTSSSNNNDSSMEMGEESPPRQPGTLLADFNPGIRASSYSNRRSSTDSLAYSTSTMASGKDGLMSSAGVGYGGSILSSNLSGISSVNYGGGGGAV
eukprot:CAMPEP_0195533140 /NCGR_PEP_ID=MMETSP0794_2-20130614/39915_1 /TAXON_ID=515487 /ORGANISM="Stephanopyxis turris, Strain CCMP 815" /LENGTH=140 /DNA_ID=CAMNT_0040665575 /DNA_START=25 /DNA_END=444 /DNA_ORIENTATION=+